MYKSGYAAITYGRPLQLYHTSGVLQSARVVLFIAELVEKYGKERNEL